MQEELLATNTDTDLRVYAVWFEMFPGDARERWPSEVLEDPRVHHYWDEQKAVGGWYGDHLADMQDQLVPESRGVGDEPVLWDAYLVYGPDAHWAEAPTGLRRWGRTVIGTRESLREALEALRKPAAKLAS